MNGGLSKVCVVGFAFFVCYLSTTALRSHAYAACSVPPGDIDGSGTTNVVDVQCAIVSALAALNPPFVAPLCTNGMNTAPDVDCNGNPDVVDVTLVIYYALGTPLSSAIDANGDKCVDACQLVGCGQTVACLNTCQGDSGCESICLALTMPKSAAAATKLADCGVAQGCVEATSGQQYVQCLTELCSAELSLCQVNGNNTSLGPCCAANPTPGCANAECMTCVCAIDSLCCTTLWDSECVAKAKSPAECDLVCECPYSCFDGVQCASQCDGDLACMDACFQKVVSAGQSAVQTLTLCLNTHDCFATATVADFVQCGEQHCLQELAGCFEAGMSAAATCCAQHAEPGCVKGSCANCVCQQDPLCCSVAWDNTCVTAAGGLCNALCLCEPLTCSEAVQCASLCTPGSGCIENCFSTATADALSALEVLIECGEVNGCNVELGSKVYLNCLGQYCKEEVNLCQNKVPLVAGSCCEAHEEPFCETAGCNDCVCNLDPLCCSITWDTNCVLIAGSTCNGGCGCKAQTCLDTFLCLKTCGSDSECQAGCAEKTTPLSAGVAADLAECASGCGQGSAEDVLNCAMAACPNGYAACAGPSAPALSGCCVEGQAPQCEDVLCAACVCSADPLCCTVLWDDQCAGLALGGCQTDCDCAFFDCFEAGVCAGKCGGDLACVVACQEKVLPESQQQVTDLFDCLAEHDCFQGTPLFYAQCAQTQCGEEVDLCQAAGVPQGSSCMEMVDCLFGCTTPECETLCKTGALQQTITDAESLRQCLNQTCDGQPGAFGCALAACPDALWQCLQ